MATFLFLGTIGCIWVCAMFFPMYRRHAGILRQSAIAQQRRRAIEEGGSFLLKTTDVLVEAVRKSQGQLFRQNGLAIATWFAFIAVDFKLAVDHPLEAGILIGMAAVLYRHTRKRVSRLFAERLRARILVGD
jgi:hypothetical protein